MAVFKCKMCGANLTIQPDQLVVECNFCDTVQTVPALDSEKKANLFNRANRLRMSGEFDKAAGVYENIIAEFPKEAEAYWGLCLSNYGIEYVDDPATAKKVPTCHRASFEKLVNDENFKLALENSTYASQQIYMEEAKEIDRIMEDILMTVRNEKPYDVFICYKETDEFGSRTIDSVLAQDVYDALTAKGMKVFFARITLEDKLGKMYEPYIFSALNSAKVMLAIGTTNDRFEAVWVRNEWSRFLKLMSKDKSKVLIPCYKDMDAYDLPEEFKMLQAQDMSKIGFMQDLVRGVEKVVAPQKIVVEKVSAPDVTNIAKPMITRAYLCLEEGEFIKADSLIEQALNIEPEYAEAYIAKTMTDNKIKNRNDLNCVDFDLYESKPFSMALRFANETENKEFVTIRNEAIYNKAINLMKKNTIVDYTNAKKLFDKIRGYRDADNLAQKCDEGIFECKYQKAISIKISMEKSSQIHLIDAYGTTAIKSFNEIIEYKDSAAMVEKCALERQEMIYEKAKEIKNNAIASKNEQLISEAIKAFRLIADYKDSSLLIKQSEDESEEMRKEKVYKEAMDGMSSKNINTLKISANKFKSLSNWKDAQEQYNRCLNKISQEEAMLKKAEIELSEINNDINKVNKSADRNDGISLGFGCGTLISIIAIIGTIGALIDGEKGAVYFLIGEIAVTVFCVVFAKRGKQKREKANDLQQKANEKTNEINERKR